MLDPDSRPPGEWRPRFPPPAGWSLAEAVSSCHWDCGHAILGALLLATADSSEVARLRSLLWRRIVDKVTAGDIRLTGVRVGRADAADIPVEFLQAAEPDYESSSLQGAREIYRDVRVRLPRPPARTEMPRAVPAFLRYPADD